VTVRSLGAVVPGRIGGTGFPIPSGPNLTFPTCVVDQSGPTDPLSMGGRHNNADFVLNSCCGQSVLSTSGDPGFFIPRRAASVSPIGRVYLISECHSRFRFFGCQPTGIRQAKDGHGVKFSIRSKSSLPQIDRTQNGGAYA
jgi:hypothetical protein